MSLRETGRKIPKEEKEYERICDVCDNVISRGQYPRLELEVTHRRYEHDGDQPERKDICSYKCLEVLAKERQTKSSTNDFAAEEYASQWKRLLLKYMYDIYCGENTALIKSRLCSIEKELEYTEEEEKALREIEQEVKTLYDKTEF